MHHLLNNIYLAAARQQAATLETVRAGVVTSVDEKTNAVKVMIQPDEIETDWVNLALPGIGWASPPEPGCQAVVLFQEGSKNVPCLAIPTYWPTVTPPAGVQPGEHYLQHSSGSRLHLKENGDVEILAANNLNITVTGNATLQAQQITLSDGTASAEFLTKFDELKTYIDGHQHSGVATGGGTSGNPTQALPSSVATTIVKGA